MTAPLQNIEAALVLLTVADNTTEPITLDDLDIDPNETINGLVLIVGLLLDWVANMTGKTRDELRAEFALIVADVQHG